MRILAALALFVSANAAFACPNLTGSFTCNYPNGASEKISISQDNKDGVTVYNYNGSMIAADNKTYPIPDDQDLKDGMFRAWCDDNNPNVLNAQITGKYYQQGQYYGDLNMLQALSLQGSDLKEVVTGSLKGAGGEQPINQTVVCTHN